MRKKAKGSSSSANGVTKSPVSRRRVVNIVSVALAHLGFAERTLEVSFVGDDAMRRLNRRTRGKNKTTDVLSFPNFHGKNGKLKVPAWAEAQPLGAVVISLDVARVQAAELRHSVTDEITRLLVHGACHVVGFDHERSARDERLMFAVEDEILATLRQEAKR